MVNDVKKESVELILVYLKEGCGKTYAVINDTIPHTWIVWGRCTRIVHSHIATQDE
jgi:hypothetical protein